LNGTIRFSKGIPKAAREQEEAPQRLSSAVGTAGFLVFDSTLGPTIAISRKIGVSVGTVFAVAQEDHEPETVSTSVAGTDVRVACLREVISSCQLA